MLQFGVQRENYQLVIYRLLKILLLLVKALQVIETLNLLSVSISSIVLVSENLSARNLTPHIASQQIWIKTPGSHLPGAGCCLLHYSAVYYSLPWRPL